jgi:hypothetical protein
MDPLDALPHRPPYRFVTGVDPDTGEVLATAPDHPALLVEVSAQACAMVQAGEGAAPPEGGVLVGVIRFEIGDAFRPGTPLRIRVTARGGMGDQTLFAVEVRDVASRQIAQGQLAVAAAP